MVEVLSIKRKKIYTIKVACPECGREIEHSFSANASVKETVELIYCNKCVAHFDIELRL